jgi:hypothetical protein
MRAHRAFLLAPLLAASTLASSACRRGDAVAQADQAIDPWQPVDPAFKGCEGG